MKVLRNRAILTLVLLIISLGTAQGAELELSAPSAFLIDACTGQVLFQKDPHIRQPVASLTKIMTLILALEALADGRVQLDDMLVASPYASSMGGSQIWWESGEQLSFKDALYAIGVGSANDASVVVAEYFGGSERQFVEKMNQRAKELGLDNTVFINASGLPAKATGREGDEHYSTAADIAKLSRHALGLPMIFELASTYKYVIRENQRNEIVLWNWNRMLDRTMADTGRRYGYPGLDGLKTGSTTEAGYCLSATAFRDNLRLISVVLGAESSEKRQEDTRILLDYGFRTYRAEVITTKDQIMGQLQVRRGTKETIDILAARTLTLPIPRSGEVDIQKKIRSARELVAPLEKGQIVGQLVVLHNDAEVAHVDLIAAEEVPKGNIFQITGSTVKKLFTSLFSKKE